MAADINQWPLSFWQAVEKAHKPNWSIGVMDSKPNTPYSTLHFV